VTRHVPVDLGRSVLEDGANSHNRLWPDLAPVAVVDPGDELTLDIRDGMDGALAALEDAGGLLTVNLDSNHPLTGPVEVRGAMPGDLLVVEPLAIEPRGGGATALLPGFGLLGDLFERPFLARWQIAGAIARSPQLPGIAVRGRPFLGCVAVAPSAELVERAQRREAALAQRGGFALAPQRTGAVPAVEPYASNALRTIPPRENGGNLDVPQVCAGSRLLLPVHVPGAMLSVGDAHFAQGEGECCGTAIEIAARVTLRVSLRKHVDGGWTPRFPAIEASEAAAASPAAGACFITTGIPLADDGENADLDLTLAARRALLEMIGWLEAERGLTREQAYVLASVAADLRIAQAVNRPNGLVVCRLPLAVFESEASP
jgi:formamidase